jgi:protein-S-isoprenylcysteine O-methyltransferase Ste14
MKPKWPMPPTLLAVSIAAMVAFHFLLPLLRVIPWPWNLLGAGPIAFGVAWNLWADQLFKRHQTTVKPHLEPSTLVQAGPFRLSRNPMYVGMAAIAAGVAVLCGSLTPMFGPVAFIAVVAIVFIPMEERAMQQAFGDEWWDYTQRVRRWL